MTKNIDTNKETKKLINELDISSLKKNKFKTLDEFVAFVDNISSSEEMNVALDILFELNFKVKNKKQEIFLVDLLYKAANWSVL